MNLPNKLTVSRFALTFFFLVAIFVHGPYCDTAALLLFSAAGMTDYWDGKIARERNIVTNFGILMDPLADKILVCSAFIALIGRGMIPAWMGVIIVARELAITGLRMLAASRNLILAAERGGKMKTIAQIVAVIAVLVHLSSPELGGAFDRFLMLWVPTFSLVALWVSVVLTGYSGFNYLWRNRRLYLQDV